MKYLTLTTGDVFKKGDQWKDDTGKWRPIDQEMHGDHPWITSFRYRRPIMTKPKTKRKKEAVAKIAKAMGWVCIDPISNNSINVQHIRHTRCYAIGEALISQNHDWNSYEANGWRCVQVEIREVKKAK